MSGLIVSCALCACQNSVNSVSNADTQMKPKLINDKRIITDGYLKTRIGILGVNAVTAPSGLLQVQIDIRNIYEGGFWEFMYPDTFRFDSRFTWFNADGMAVKTTPWVGMTLTAGETAYLKGVAPNADCTDFTFELKQAK